MRLNILLCLIVNIELSIQLSAIITPKNELQEEMKSCVLKIIDNYIDNSTTVVLFEEDMHTVTYWEEVVKHIKLPLVIVPVVSLSDMGELRILVVSFSYLVLRNHLTILHKFNKKRQLMIVGQLDLTLNKFNFINVNQELNISDVVLIPGKYNSIKLLASLPFINGTCDKNLSFVQIDVFKSGSFRKGVNPFTLDKHSNMYGCPLVCIGYRRPPMGILSTDTNGRLSFQGITSEMLNALSSKLNFTPKIIMKNYNLTFPRASELIYQHSKYDIIEYLNTGRADIALGEFSFYKFFDENTIVMGEFIFNECITAGIPWGSWKKPPASEKLWSLYINEFSLTFWIVHVIVTFATDLIFYIVTILHGDKSFLTFPQFTFTTLLGQPFAMRSSVNSARVLVTSWLIYGLMYRTAYEASLRSMMTKPSHSLYISSMRELMESSLKIGMNEELFQFLQKRHFSSVRVTNQISDKYVKLTGENFANMNKEINSTPKMAILENIRQLRDFSNHGRNSFSQGRLYFLKHCMVPSFSTPLIFPLHSSLIEPINKILTRVAETRMLNVNRLHKPFHFHNVSKTVQFHNSDSPKKHFKLSIFLGQSIMILHIFNVVMFVCEFIFSIIKKLIKHKLFH